jgi:Domain of unknown function (DUF5664)
MAANTNDLNSIDLNSMAAMEYHPLANPKDVIGSTKLPLSLWPATATALGCLGMLEGKLKYGKANFRAKGILLSVYLDAAIRHLSQFLEGEENDPDSGLDHLAHALATVAIIVDARANGKLTDDRPMSDGAFRKLVDELTPHVARLQAKYADKNPKHYLIGDEEGKK